MSTANKPPHLPSGQLSKSAYALVEPFIVRTLDGYKSGTLTRDQAVADLAHVVTALDAGNAGEATGFLRASQDEADQ